MKKTALVTGALGGIGFATVRRLQKEGYAVCGMDVLPQQEGEKRFEGLADCRYLQGDLACTADRERAVQAAAEPSGRLDVLVNVAGIAPRVRADLLEMTEESYDRVMNVNTKGTLFLSQLAAKQMLGQTPVDGARGSIVNISSCSAYTSSVSRGEYCISKAGVSMVTMLFADRLAGEGILVNEVCPGVIRTGMTAAVKEKYDRLIANGLIPVARWGEPEDVANAVWALCSGMLGYTTGQSLMVDGGLHIRKL